MHRTLVDAVDEVLGRAAFFSESHAVKGLLALDRLATRYALPDQQIHDLLEVNQLLHAPRIDGLLSDSVHWNAASIDDRRLRGMLDGPVFPMAYVAAVEWARRRGLRDLVDAYRSAAARNVDFLGHAWTIWCSFLELLPEITGERQQALFAERFAELVAVQLRAPAPLSLPPVDPQPLQDDVAVRLLALAHPGYLAHTAVTMAYVVRHGARLEERERKNAIHVVHRMAASHELPSYAYHPARYEGPVDGPTFERVVREGLENGPREVHTLTALDALHDLWALGDEPTQRGTLAVAIYLRDLRVERLVGGERKE